jgi:hypothetical protein
MALLTVVPLTPDTPVTPAYVAATGGGDTVTNSDGKVYLHYKNASGGSLTVTVVVQTATVQDGVYGTLTKSSIVKAIAAGAEAIIGPINKRAYNGASDIVSITYSGVTSLTVAAYSHP